MSTRTITFVAIAACAPGPADNITKQPIETPPIGTLPGRVGVSATGAATFELPIDVPPGRDGLAPRLAVVYDSRGGNGPLGVGWSLRGLSRIARCPSSIAHGGRTAGVAFFAGDRLCLDGDPLAVVAGTHGAAGSEYRTVPDAQTRIVAGGALTDGTPASFTVYHRDGRIAHYTRRLEGPRVSSTALDGTLTVSPAQAVYGWLPEVIEDRSGNSMTIEWASDLTGDRGVAFYPIAIRYTYGPGGPSGPPTRMVRFDYEARPDWIVAYSSGFRSETGRRLKAIETFAHDGATLALVHRYRFAFAADSITQRSLLAGITKCDASDVCLPQTVPFTEPGDFAHDWPIIATDLGRYADLRAADVDGDGRDDLLWHLRPREEGGVLVGDPAWRLQLRTDDGFATPIEVHPFAELLALVDVDLDGRAELVMRGDGGAGADVYRWTDGTFLVVQHIDTIAAHPTLPKIADLDGDGAPDLVYRISTPGATSVWKWRRNTGWAAAPFGPEQNTGISEPYGPSDSIGAALRAMGNGATQVAYDAGTRYRFLFTSGGYVDAGFMNVAPDLEWARFFDINGDGLDDLLDLWTGNARLNTGAGFGPAYAVLGSQDKWLPPKQTVPAQVWTPEIDSGIRIVDLNNDGRMDVVRGDYRVACLSRGLTLACRPYPDLEPDHFDDFAAYPYGFLDVDGDGVQDLMQIHGGKLEVRRRMGAFPDRITAVRNGLGATESITYATTTSRAVFASGPACTYPQRCNVRRFPVVARVERPNGAGTNLELYGYADARFDVRGEGFLGFARTRRHDTARDEIIETTYAVDPSTDGRYPRLGMPTRRTTFQRLRSDRVRIVTTAIENTAWTAPGASYFARPTREDRSEYEWTNPGGIVAPGLDTVLHAGAAGTPFRTATVTRTFDNYANLVSERRAVAGGSDDTTTWQYDNRTTDWLIGLPVRRMTTGVSAGGTSETSEQTYAHDALGRLVEEIVEPARPELTRFTRYIRAMDGLVERIERGGPDDPIRTVRFTYDPARVFVAQTTNAAGHVTAMWHHSGFGLVERVRDPNGAETALAYDNFGRLHERRDPGGRITTIAIVREGGPTVAYRVRSDVNTGERSYVDFDVLARPISKGRAIASTWSTIDQTYDVAGRIATQSLPRFAGAPRTWVVVTRDLMGRVERIDYPDGSALRQLHAPLATEQWDARGSYIRYDLDADGRIARSVQRSGGRDLAATYHYGPFGRLARVVDPLGTTTDEIAYDALGRRISIVNADAGARTFRFNAFGEVVAQNDPLGTTTIDRDALGRVIGVTDTDGGRTELTWDAPAIGVIAKTQSPDGIVTQYAYDGLGRRIGETLRVGGESFTTEQWFDAFGRVAGIRYPSSPLGGLEVGYEYGADGLPVRAWSAGGVWWEARNHDAWMHTTLESVGSGAHVERTFEPLTGRLARLQSYRVEGKTRDVFQDLRYGYLPNGLVSSRTDAIAARTETFGYDDVHRLTEWTVTEAGVTDVYGYTYDDLGNMLSSTGLDGHHAYGHGLAAGPHVVTSVDGVAFDHDALGRRTRDEVAEIEYTPFDLPRRITTPASTTTLAYDALHARRIKTGAAGTTIYVPELFERRTDPAGDHAYHFFVRANGRLIAEVVEHAGAREYRYVYTDHQGSADVITDGATVVERRWYTPFGQLAAPAPVGLDAHTGSFTGHEGDWDERLVNMRGRIYDPRTRRFLTPDPLVPQPLTVIGWNRFAYVSNSPLTFVDPTGFYDEWDYDDLDDGEESGYGDCGDCDGFQGTHVHPADDNDEYEYDGNPGPGFSYYDDSDPGSDPPDMASDYDDEPPDGYGDLYEDQAYDEYGYRDGYEQPGAYGGDLVPDSGPRFPHGAEPMHGGTLFDALGRLGSSALDWARDHVSYGASASGVMILPILSGGGGEVGLNVQAVPGGNGGVFAVTTPNEAPAVGLCAGVGPSANVAIGEGAWTGAFREVGVMTAWGSGSVFWSPGDGGWVGVSVGVGPGVGAYFVETEYTQVWSPE